MTRRRIPRALLQEAGFTLAELLVAIALLTIGIVGVGAMLTFQAGGLSGGADVGLAAVTRANYLSTATMLAQERIEQIKNFRYCQTCSMPLPPVLIDDFAAKFPANFGDEPYTTITNYPNFHRTIQIQPDTPATGTKTITVQVFFRPPTMSEHGTEGNVSLVTIIGQRP